MGKKFFLEEVVDYTFKKYKDFRKLSIVFPNRRAGLYFQKALSKKNDSNTRIGGTIASSIFLMMQGIQILRIHDVNEVMQGIKVFRKLIKN